MKKILGVNGLYTHGGNNIDRLLWKLRDKGHIVGDIALPERGFISARWGADDDAETIAKVSNDGDVLVAHSFGCLRAAEAMELVDYSHVFMFAPAMQRGYDFGDQASKITCFHSHDDLAILMGQLLLFHPFGAAGRKGFYDKRVKHVELSGGHNAYFEKWLHFCAIFVHDTLQPF